MTRKPFYPATAPLALTMGEPAGIGLEITIAAWRRLAGSGPTFFLLDDPERLAAAGVPTVEIAKTGDAHAAFPTALPVLPVRLRTPARAGQPDAGNAPAVIESIERAVRLVQSGEAAALVTNPIQKSTLYDAGFSHPGHTEFLGALAGNGNAPLMMLASPLLRVVPVTVHISLSRAIAALDSDLIVERGRVTWKALRDDFGIAKPRLAVAGLNPHAGEDGAMGTEEREIIVPAIARLRAEGIAASGPHPPDTLFTHRMRQSYDAALCMYHDQALIPLKTIDMDGGVNVTLGLPIVRTSPDHGTALDIAGKGIADPGSLIAAIRLAQQLAERRNDGRKNR